jgi:hypothetical protein
MQLHAYLRSFWTPYAEQCCISVQSSWLPALTHSSSSSSTASTAVTSSNQLSPSSIWNEQRESEVATAAAGHVSAGWLCGQWLPVAARRMSDEYSLRAAHSAKRHQRRQHLMNIKANAPRSTDSQSGKQLKSRQPPKKSSQESALEAELLLLNAPLDVDDAEGGVQVLLMGWSNTFAFVCPDFLHLFCHVETMIFCSQHTNF